jgi:hypothetical protein
MPSSLALYSVVMDAWQLAYQPEDNFPGMLPEGQTPPPMPVPEGSWTAFVSPISVNQNSGIGLSVELASGERLELLAHQLPPPHQATTFFVQHPGRQITLRVEFEEGVLSFSHSVNMNDWVEVARISPAEAVTEVGVVLRYDRPQSPAAGVAGAARMLSGIWQHIVEEVTLAEPVAARVARVTPRAEVTVTSTSEPPVHVIVGAQFGDLEFDVGKSVRWVTWFCDNTFVLDVNVGTQRYWVVNWAETFPDAKHAVTGINFFVVPAEFRKEQWRQYKLAFGDPSEDDWFLFIDAHEGLGVDNRSLPDDYAFAPFKSFLWREIQRAEDLGQPFAVLPFYVFLRSGNITNVTYETTPQGLPGDVPSVQQALSVPYYLAHQGLRRLWKVSELRKANFDWSQIDTPVAPSAGVTTLAARGSGTPATTNTAWTNTTLAVDGAVGTNPGTYAVWTNSASGAVGTIEISGYGFSAISATATLDSVTVTIRQRVNDPARYTSVTFQPYSGATPIGSPANAALVTTAANTTATFPVTLAQLRADDFTIRVTVTRAPVVTAGTFSLDYVDVTAAYTSGVKLQILSYGYAHWNLQDIVPPATTVEPLSEANDDGWRMRNLLSRVRPVPSLPIGDWQDPSTDPAGLPGPWAPADANNPDPIDPTTGLPMPPPVAPDSSLEGLVTPLYDCVFRLNMRDGVWYEAGVSGNIPLKWDSTKWVTEYDPEQWADDGVEAHDPYYVAEAP